MDKSKLINRQERKGLIWGLLGVVGFSLTLPATKIAVSAFNPTVVGLGRAIIAAVLAILLLFIRRERIPSIKEFKGLLLVAMGVIVGFPLLSAWAMENVSSSHGAVVLALLPLSTAGIATVRNGERPSVGYWMCSLLGCIGVIGYAFYEGFGQFKLADIALVGSVLAASVGYAEGGRLAKSLGGWQVICWALVLSFPFLIYPVVRTIRIEMIYSPLYSWICFGYVSIVSQFLAFIAWYRGLALAGISRVSQLQYLQPFFTMLASCFLFGELLKGADLMMSIVVLFAVMMGRKTTVKRRLEKKLNSSSVSNDFEANG